MLSVSILWAAGGMERFYKTEGYESGSNVLRMVGYFSLVGLLRVHTLVGDYHGALKALAVIHPFQRTNLYTPKIAGETHINPLFAVLCGTWWLPSQL
jgi:translation initiation factor 3 subunit L